MTKSIDFTQEISFQKLFVKMQIDEGKTTRFNYQPYQFTDAVWNNPLWNGIQFTPNELHHEIKQHKMNGLFYQGKRVIAYWSKQVLYEGRPRELTELAYTYHLTWCKDMNYLEKNYPRNKALTITCNARLEQPVMICDRSGHMQGTERHILRPCPHCLEQLDWKGYKLASVQERLKIGWDFFLDEYLHQRQ